MLGQYVVVLENCSDAKMRHLIKSARAVLLPSKAEGYGLPLAEAMAIGTPAICSDLKASREIGNGIPLYLPALDEAAWTAAVAQFMENGIESTRQRNLLKLQRTWSWADHLNLVDGWMADLPKKLLLPADIPVSRYPSYSKFPQPRQAPQ
jgi:glycosyltransferase involved in cell wall biosynthesis